MAESETEITKEELQNEIADILKNVSLENTSTKKVIQKLEKKLGVDLTERKKLIDQLVMDYVNSLDSDEDSTEEEPLAKVAPKKKVKKQDNEEEEDENDNSNDSDWGYHHQDGHLLDELSDDGYHQLYQEPTVSTSESRYGSNQPRKALILKRVAQNYEEEDESDIFGKLTAKKLRKLNDEQRDAMMIQINQLFYDKCYKRAEPPKRRMENKATSTAPAVQYEAKKIFRVGALPYNLSVTAPIPITLANLHRPVVTSNDKNKPRPVVPLSNVPVVQAATPPGPVLQPVPANNEVSENNVNSGHKTSVM